MLADQVDGLRWSCVAKGLWWIL